MNQYFNLPSEYSLRPATSSDTLTILLLLFFLNNYLAYTTLLLPLIILIIVRYVTGVVEIEPFVFAFIPALNIVILFFINLPAIYSSDKSWVIEYKSKIVACALVQSYSTHSELLRLYVSVFHRKKGLGSSLITTLIREAQYPIYVVSTHTATRFYLKLGFVPIPRYRLPQRLSQKSRMGYNVLGFISQQD